MGWLVLLSVGIVAGLVAAGLVFTQGLVVTNLNDLVPWGLWIIVDLSSIALAGGAFFLSALVYLVGIKRFKPIARLAVFTGLLTYSAALSTLMLDIGRPDRFWHSLTYWNTHSMLWEVTMSIFLYFNVLLLEAFPLVASHRFFDRLPSIRAAAEFVHRGASAGRSGTTLLDAAPIVVRRDLRCGDCPPDLVPPDHAAAVHYLTIAGGSAMNIAAALVVGWLRRRDVVPREVLFDVAKIVGVVLLIYLNIRFWDIWAGNYGYVPLRSEATAELTGGSLAMGFWTWEIVLGAVLPSFLLLWGARARSEASLFLGSALAVIGLVMNRWNTTLIGFTTPLSMRPALTYPLVPTYSPALVEWAAVIGILSAIMLIFTLGMRYLPAFELQPEVEHTHSLADSH
jgi:Ni/Fe-hydrogenase subunit HybB-like protein